MTGRVDWQDRPLVPVTLRGPLGHASIEAVLDTGFNGSLCVPDALVSQLGLKRHRPALSRTADGRVGMAYTYWVEVEWLDGPVRCLAVSGGLDECLVGTALLDGRVLEIDFGAAKRVTVR